MIWCKFRLSDGSPIAVLSPMAQAESFTIVKGGVFFWRPGGDKLMYYENDKIAEIHENFVKYVQEPVVVDGKTRYYKWMRVEPRDITGRAL